MPVAKTCFEAQCHGRSAFTINYFAVCTYIYGALLRAKRGWVQERLKRRGASFDTVSEYTTRESLKNVAQRPASHELGRVTCGLD